MVGDVKAFHIRTHWELPDGGYTVLVKERKDGKYNVTIVQCNGKHKYNKAIGVKVAMARMKTGKFFVNSVDELVVTLTTLSDKCGMGAQVPEMEVIDA